MTPETQKLVADVAENHRDLASDELADCVLAALRNGDVAVAAVLGQLTQAAAQESATHQQARIADMLRDSTVEYR